MKRARVVIAGEHRLMLDGLQSIVQSEFDMAGFACDGRTLVDVVLRVNPDLVLTEDALPVSSGIDAALRIRKRLPDIHVVLITRRPDRERLQEALCAGVSGYLLKQCSGREVVSALHEVLGGRCYVTPLLTADLFAAIRGGNRSPALTLRQREVLQLVVEGRSMKEIAALLSISRKTVEYHKYGIMQALGVRTTTQLIQYGLEHGLAGETARPGKRRKHSA